MERTRAITAAFVAAAAGLAAAQPVIDGIFDSATEASFYGPIRWVNTVPTSFGDNVAGMFTGGNFGDPENVTTGIEIAIPKSALGNPTSFRLAGWVTSGDRSFMSNQIIGSLPIDTPNIGGNPDFSDEGAFPGRQFITVSSIPNATIIVDGSADAGYGPAVFTQTNYTGFGDSQEGTPIGGGGSEIDQVFVAQDATNIYVLIAGNLEANGNGLDLHFDTDNGATGATFMGSGSGSGAFIVDGPGVTFDTGAPADTFRPNYIVSVDSFDHDSDGGTPNVPRAWYGVYSGNNATVNLLGNIAGYGAANAGTLTGGDMGVPTVSLAVDNSNIGGVIGSPSQATPVTPDANWAYGSELNNLRASIVQDEVGNDFLYIFIGANLEVNFNKLSLFIDCQPGGQNRVGFDSNGDPVDNVDISFGALQNMAGLRFDEGFTANYWFNVNTGQDGGSGNLINFTDAAVLRSDGRLIDPFTFTPLDYGAYFGGEVTDGVGNPVADPVELMDFSGPRVDIQDGFSSNLFTNYGPRQTQINPFSPIPGLIQTAINNSNVAGVTGDSANDAAVRAVNTGVEICINLDELGWDGVQDILIAGWIASGGFNFMSNQVLGDPAGTENLGNVPDIDFSQIPGTQYINLSVEVQEGCNPADIAPPYGILDLADISTFITAFQNANPIADLAPPFGVFDLADIAAFVAAFTAGCP